MTQSRLQAIITRTLNQYRPEYRPTIRWYSDSDPNKPNIVRLVGGDWRVRKAIEEALSKYLDAITNYPEEKTLRLLS